MGAAAATAGNAAGVGRSGAGDMQRGGGDGEKSQYREDGPQHRRAEEGSEALTGGSKVVEAWLRWSRIVGFGRKNGQAPILGRNRIVQGGSVAENIGPLALYSESTLKAAP